MKTSKFQLDFKDLEFKNKTHAKAREAGVSLNQYILDCIENPMIVVDQYSERKMVEPVIMLTKEPETPRYTPIPGAVNMGINEKGEIVKKPKTPKESCGAAAGTNCGKCELCKEELKHFKDGVKKANEFIEEVKNRPENQKPYDPEKEQDKLLKKIMKEVEKPETPYGISEMDAPIQDKENKALNKALDKAYYESVPKVIKAITKNTDKGDSIKFNPYPKSKSARRSKFKKK